MKRILVISGICALVVSLLFVSILPTHASFVIATWNDDDGYGQGISAVYLHENSTGVWVKVKDPAFYLPTDDTEVTMNETTNTALRFEPAFRLNHTHMSVTTPEEGMNIMRSNIEVSVLGAVVYSEENVTLYYGGQIITGGVPIGVHWYYASIIVPLLIRAGLVYVVEITYEINPYLYE